MKWFFCFEKNWGFDHDSSEQMVFLHLDARTSGTSRVRIWIYSQNIIFQLRFEVSFSSFWLKYWAEGFDLEARFPFFWNFVFGNFRFDLRSTLSVYSAGELFVGACDTVRYRACWFDWVRVTLQIGLSPWWIIVVGLVSPVAWEKWTLNHSYLYPKPRHYLWPDIILLRRLPHW